MGSFTDKVIKGFGSIRSAWDEIVESFGDHFLSDPRRARVPGKMFRDGIAIITPNEVNDRHGTGVILSRVFEDFDGILSVRTSNLHGEHRFGKYAVRFFHNGLSRSESYARLAAVLRDNNFRYIICVPYHADDFLTAIILKDLFAAKLCVYIMDDNYLVHERVPGNLIREALGKADLRLAISPQMRDAYEQRFGVKFWVRPPVVTPSLIREACTFVSEQILEAKRGVAVGSVWSNQILERLATAVSEAGLTLDWYGNSDASWLAFNRKGLVEKGINCCGHIAEADLAKKLDQYAFCLVPSGTMDESDQRIEMSKFSLPTRLPFLLSVGNIPTIVLGHRLTAAAQFVKQFDFGETVDYDGDQLKAAVARLCERGNQARIREHAISQGHYFSSKGVGRWILDSMECKRPATKEMETLFDS